MNAVLSWLVYFGPLLESLGLGITGVVLHVLFAQGFLGSSAAKIGTLLMIGGFGCAALSIFLLLR